uniref:Uncharacterized protein n=1 Tax=Physcomitrium patens TaxID=3218 RepID=A0A7I3ZQX3_PHYPA
MPLGKLLRRTRSEEEGGNEVLVPDALPGLVLLLGPRRKGGSVCSNSAFLHSIAATAAACHHCRPFFGSHFYPVRTIVDSVVLEFVRLVLRC